MHPIFPTIAMALTAVLIHSVRMRKREKAAEKPVTKQLPRYFALGKFYPLFPQPYVWFVKKPFRIVWETPWHYINPLTYIRTVKYFWQRGTRGWADCDWWNMNSYVAQINLEMLRELRANAHGYPACFAPEDPQNNSVQEVPWSGTEDECPGFQEWMKTLDKMILGFEAYIQLSYDTECAPEECWGDRIESESFEDMIRQLNDPTRKGFQRDIYEAWSKPLQAQMDEGLALYTKHFHSLWD